MALIPLRTYLDQARGASVSGPGTLPARPIFPPPSSSDFTGPDRSLARLGAIATAARGAGTTADLFRIPAIGTPLGVVGSGLSLARALTDDSLPPARRALTGVRDIATLTDLAGRSTALRSVVPGLEAMRALRIPTTAGAPGLSVVPTVGAALGLGLGAERLARGEGEGAIDIASSALSYAPWLAEGLGIAPGVIAGEAGGSFAAAGAAGAGAAGAESGAALGAGLAGLAVAAPVIIGQVGNQFAQNDRRKALANSIARTKEAQSDFGTIVSTLSGVRSEDDFLKALDTPVPNVGAKLGTILHTIARQNLAGDYAEHGWDPDPKLRASVGLFERLGIPVQAPTPKNQAGGPPPNPWEPNTPAFWELYQLTGTPVSVQGVRLNTATGGERWGRILTALSDAAVKADPALAQAGPEPVSREALNRRITEGRFGGYLLTTNEQVAERTGRPADRPVTTAERLGSHLAATYERGGEPEHLRQRLIESYQALTGTPWTPSVVPPAELLDADRMRLAEQWAMAGSQ